MSEQMRWASVPVVGTSPLLIYAFNEKAYERMLGSMISVRRPEKPTPEQVYEEAFYRLIDGTPGFPAAGFKRATVSAACLFYDRSRSILNSAITVDGQLDADGRKLVPIQGEPRMYESEVHVKHGGMFKRYFPEFPIWSAVLTVGYDPSIISLGDLIAIINAGGEFFGVGQWRKEMGGEFGSYRIKGQVQRLEGGEVADCLEVSAGGQ